MGDADSSSRATRAVKKITERMRSRPESTFAPSDILPADGQQPYPKRPESDFRPSYDERRDELFGVPSDGIPMSGEHSAGPPSVFDQPDGQQEHETEPTTVGSDEQEGYDLKPPPPNISDENVEALATRFFSNDHLDVIIRDQNAGPRFTQFLEQFRPQYSSSLRHYLQARKAATAVEYANAVATNIPASQGESPFIAASMDATFDAKSREIAEELLEEALPAYLTHRLTTIATDTLVKTITGNNIPAMQDLIPNLAEVYCISDPSLADNPIVYASEGMT